LFDHFSIEFKKSISGRLGKTISKYEKGAA
jgi:hypothetical protein